MPPPDHATFFQAQVLSEALLSQPWGEEKSSPQKHQKEKRLLNKPGHKLKADHNHPFPALP